MPENENLLDNRTPVCMLNGAQNYSDNFSSRKGDCFFNTLFIMLNLSETSERTQSENAVSVQVLTKTSTENEIKTYFQKVLELIC